MRLTWFGHSSYRLEYEDKVIYLNPYAGEQEWYDKKANLILISSFEFDHWNRSLINRIVGDNTHIFGTPRMAREMYGVRSFTEKKSLTFEDGTELVVLPTDEDIGWLISTKEGTIYFVSHKVHEDPYDHAIDFVVIPVAGGITYRQAVEAVKVIKPKIAIPAHYGRIAGTVDDAELFKELVEDERKTKVLILQVNKPAEL